MLLKVLICVYIGRNVYKMLDYSEDTVYSANTKLKLQDAPAIIHKQDDGLFFFWVLKNSKGGNKPFKMTDF